MGSYKHSSSAIITDRSAEINASFNIYLNIAAIAGMVIIFILHKISPLGWFNKAEHVSLLIPALRLAFFFSTIH